MAAVFDGHASAMQPCGDRRAADLLDGLLRQPSLAFLGLQLERDQDVVDEVGCSLSKLPLLRGQLAERSGS